MKGREQKFNGRQIWVVSGCNEAYSGITLLRRRREVSEVNVLFRQMLFCHNAVRD